MICGGIFDLASKQAEVKKLEKEMANPLFWEDNHKAQAIIKACNELKEWTLPYENISVDFENISILLPEAYACNDDSLIEELEMGLHQLEKELEDLEIKRMLSGELDSHSCYLTINAGAGGTESCDWVSMLFRMYERWIYKRKWKTEVLDLLDGEVAGIKSLTLKIEGHFAYGYCKAEKGVHRLIRISPFDSNAKRHTSFASVEITPIMDDSLEIAINMDDIRVDTYRASGAGGQHVNKTDSAVRMTHLPTGIVVSCQNQRSQIQNRDTCLKMLKSKLYELEVLAREKKLKDISGEKKDIAWGSQIRNYIFHPYTLVKDTRTKYETGNIQSVMDGEIDPFIIAYLKEFA